MPRVAALVANGELRNSSQLAQQIAAHDYIVAVDGGLKHCLELGIEPSLVIGDWDSSSDRDRDRVPKVPREHFPTDKAETDLELAIKMMQKQGVKRIDLFAPTGGRIDHFLSTLHLVARHLPNFIHIITGSEELFRLPPLCRVPTFQGQIISLIPLFGPVDQVSTSGLKWNLTNTQLNSDCLSQSNEALSDFFDVEHKSGSLLCCLNS